MTGRRGPAPLVDVEGIVLRVVLGALELRLGADADADALGHLVAAGLFPEDAPTVGSWYDPDDPVGSAARTVALHRSGPLAARPDRWTLPFAVRVEGRVVGAQHLCGDDSEVVSTESWLAPSARGAGVGTAARLAVLSVAFDHLGVDLARSAALAGNDASSAVSLKVGYRHAGFRVVANRGNLDVAEHFDLTAELWRSRPRPPVICAGVDWWRVRLGR